jgi:hypothetical protein
MAKVVMIKSSIGVSNEHGSQTRSYQAGEELELKEVWQKTLAQSFIDACVANEVGGNQFVPETKEQPAKVERAAKKSK